MRCSAPRNELRYIVTLEEHSILGGLGGAVAEILCEAGLSGVRFLRIGLPSEFCTTVGDQDYLRRCYGLDRRFRLRKNAAVIARLISPGARDTEYRQISGAVSMQTFRIS